MPEAPTTQSRNDDFAEAFGEPITHILDMATWQDGSDLAALYDALRQNIADSVAQEKRVADPIRQLLFPRLRDTNNRYAPRNAGVYQLSSDEIAEVHRNLLFNGATECCDGTIAVHDSLLLSVVQIGLALVAYQGAQNTWVQRLYRRDLRTHYPDPLVEAEELLRRRGLRDTTEEEETEGHGGMSRLVRRALMEYAERAALVNLSSARWRMGHGNPVPINLLVPTSPELVRASCDTLRNLILEHKRFVYVASEPANRFLLTLGNALHEAEFAIVDTLATQFSDNQMRKLAATQAGHPMERDLIQQLLHDVRFEVITGVYRAHKQAPARVFYAHKDFACEAAALAIADSTLQPYRGFPMLIDLADIVAGNTFDGGSFHGSLQDAYAAAGEPTRYLGERETRS